MSTAAALQARLLLIDNYDSFTYNLVQLFRELGAQVQVFRNDAIDVATAEALQPTHLCISPGPGGPANAGVSMPLIAACAGRLPVLGVCLGLQALVAVFGGSVGRARRPMHGKTSLVEHDNGTILHGMPRPFAAGRYHSLIAQRPLPAALRITACTAGQDVLIDSASSAKFSIDSALTAEISTDSALTAEFSTDSALTAEFSTDSALTAEIMAVQHVRWTVAGVQFHPESILTPQGVRVLANFLQLRGGCWTEATGDEA